MSDQDDWSANSNDAITISLHNPGDASPHTLSSFHPQFTYSIFGDEENIAGYQGLKINLQYAAHDLKPHLDIQYERKYKAIGDMEATDIEKELRPYLPSEAFSKSQDFHNHLQQNASAKAFQPPGDLADTYSSRGRNFEIWSGLLSDPNVKLLVSRMQILVSFFIEGGTPIDIEEEDWSLARWRIYFVYEKTTPTQPNASPYSFVGYASSYRFISYYVNGVTSKSNGVETKSGFTLPPSVTLHPSDLPSRVRISQFLILPSHHSHGHGSHLYDAMVKTMLESPTCLEITVEDPSEAFDDLRDYRDFARLQQNGTLKQITFETTVEPNLVANKTGVRVPTSRLLNKPLLESLRKKNKIAPRQFYRLVEMHLFSKIDRHARQAGTARLTQRARTKNDQDRAFYFWRLLVKQRVYKQSRDTLIQVEQMERAEKVEQAVGEIVGDYERLLQGMQKWKEAEAKSEGSDGAESSGGPSRPERAKRKILDDEDEEMEGGTPKRARSEVL